MAHASKNVYGQYKCSQISEKKLKLTECYVTVGTFARRGLGSLSNDTELSWFGVIRTKSEEDLDSF